MKKNLSDYIVALAVIACSIVLLGALTIALTGYQLKKPTRLVQVDYPDVTGIHLASELRYAGAPAGHVIGIRFLNADERTAAKNPKNAVRVTLNIMENVPPIPADVEASIGSDTLLSEKFITLSAGTAGKDLLANNAVLQGKAGGLDELFNSAGPAVAKLGDVLDDLQAALKGIVPKVETALDSLNGVVTGAQGVVTGVQGLVKNVNALVMPDGSLHTALDKLNDAIAKLQGVEGTLDEVLKKASGLVTGVNENLDGRMKELSIVLQNLKVATTYLKSFSQSLAEKPSRLIFSGKSTDLKPEDEILKNNKPVPAKTQPQR